MAKIKLTKVLREGLEQEKKKQETVSEMRFYLDDFRKRLEDLKSKMRRDGYNV